MNSTCPYCGVGCGVTVNGGAIAGDAAHPANFGKLCVKGSALAQTLDDSARLTMPIIGGASASWDDALGLVAKRFSEAIAQYGPESVAIYGSGQFLTEDYYVANKLMKGFIGAANIDTNSRLCMASTVAGHIRAFGEDVVPGCYEDIDEADLLVFVGANAAWCHPVLFERAQAARTVRGAKIVVIDPRHTATAALADLHLPIRPEGDVALFQRLLVALCERGKLDNGFIAAHTSGFAETLAAAHDDAETGLDPAALQTFLDWFCDTERTVTLFSQGVNQSACGSDKVNAITNVHLATRRIGRPGMGPFSLTGQPNAMGGREVGGLANQLAAHLRFETESDRALLRDFWNAPRLAEKPGLKAVDMFDAVLNGRIKAIWIAATNPAESLPRASRVRAALEACPFVAVSDCWPTATTHLANVVLPAAGWGEKDGTVTNSERRISRQRPFRAAPGMARPDWWIFTEVARRMGFAAAFSYTSPADIFREHAALSGFRNQGARLFNIAPLAAMTDEEYDALLPFQWPLNRKRLFAEGGFPTPDGKARFVPVTAAAPAKRDASFPFTLNTGRLRDQWHMMTRTGFVPSLMTSADEANFEISPADAAQLGVAEGDLLRVTTRHGRNVLPAAITKAQRPGEIFAAMHWTSAHSGAGNVNQLTGPLCDKLSGQPALKHERAAVEGLQAAWHGILQSRTGTMPHGQFHAARVPIAGGMHRLRLSGWKPLPRDAALSDWAARLCGADADDERVEFYDSARKIYRLGVFRHFRLVACLFIAPARPALPDGVALSALFAAPVQQANRTAILRGKIGDSGPRDRVVCVCHNVTESAITGAIKAQRLASVAAIGAACKAGTNCGSCKGELAQLLTQLTSELVS
jgi:assimilatory nitrate reductase catalytic subunit